MMINVQNKHYILSDLSQMSKSFQYQYNKLMISYNITEVDVKDMPKSPHTLYKAIYNVYYICLMAYKYKADRHPDSL